MACKLLVLHDNLGSGDNHDGQGPSEIRRLGAEEGWRVPARGEKGGNDRQGLEKSLPGCRDHRPAPGQFQI